ncbi:hypothetical protein [Streptomyces sp. NPDC059783]|uniref:hypothetical protein n=1 Tax=Streptomyces sp. NPDC059783 TaxID=3346944 RepID=UPI003650F0B5
MPAADDAREWAGTTDDMYDLHRFDASRQAFCDPAIRTCSRITDHDELREPYMTLRSRAQIEAHWAAYMYRFCAACTNTPGSPGHGASMYMTPRDHGGRTGREAS